MVAPPVVDRGHVVGAADGHAARHGRARHQRAHELALALLQSCENRVPPGQQPTLTTKATDGAAVVVVIITARARGGLAGVP